MSDKQFKQLSEDCREVLTELRGVCHSLVRQFASLQADHQEIKNRMTYLEYGLHAENERLQDENLGWRQGVDYDSEDYCSNEDSLERKY
ncbi:hypothetical protein H6F78_17820 [Coleofasciculus sp. FACHB-64]|uniref:hypothetical protein n=1 Tax=Cyanophyceae TaxID=3028117 RepID=UPI00168947FA|nr:MULTISPECIES: hypothetical protein [unclassified Coleofasciculus]MBD1840965.1 hypothetical protein [Coleofasciculus sp. FACHB-501]MBD2047428.1 hypothetical protein [Coleofasciculus sp. FACHB-64]